MWSDEWGVVFFRIEVITWGFEDVFYGFRGAKDFVDEPSY